ncbi:heterokaryon incompatibility protein [Colletotrichum asianum]|uniref:Heterokaryon incompatibility protein n=1 Tax=Colletotrichum asianum TaxID=702518 RepID=A0A8H3ZTM3_9PEZI|nr:heterokaryon incompatibility protein [Colletotrichum asianum]
MNTNNSYRYASLASSRSIRLVILHSSTKVDAPLACDLIEVNLDSPPEYETLSYTWNNESPSESMTVMSTSYDCQTLLLTPNCASALRVLRKRIVGGTVGDIGLWVDAICINQSSNAEKSTQVGMMAEIYNRASRVILWLGMTCAPPDLKSLWMIQLLRFLTTNGYEPEWLVPLMKWLHPIVVKRHHQYLYQQCPLSTIRAIAYPNIFDHQVSNRLYLHFSLLQSLQYVNTSQPPPWMLALSLQNMLRMKASDPRDKIFALRELFHGVLQEIRVSYDRSPEELCSEATRLLITKQQNFKVLLHGFVQPNSPTLPSWAVNWVAEPTSVLSRRRLWESAASEVNACNGAEPSINFSADGLRLVMKGMKIENVGPCISQELHPVDRANEEVRAKFGYSFPDFITQSLSTNAISRDGLTAGFKELFKIELVNEELKRPASEEAWRLLDKQTSPEEIWELTKYNENVATELIVSSAGGALFVTESGRLGKANSEILEGDLICVFAGLSVPLVVRPQGPYFEMVSPALVHGKMRGESRYGWTWSIVDRRETLPLFEKEGDFLASSNPVHPSQGFKADLSFPLA